MTMATIKAYTDIEQSKKLAEILPLESADMYYEPSAGFRTEPSEAKIGDIEYAHPRSIRCWSLATLINILPQIIDFKGDKYYLRFMKDYVEYANDEVSITGRCLHTTGNNNLVDACVEMIEKLHELKML